MTYQLIRFAAVLSLGGVLTAACSSSTSGGSTNPDASSGTGAATGTGGGTGTGGSVTGNGGVASGNGGATGNGGAVNGGTTGNGGNAGNAGSAGNAGAGGAGALTCPAQQPNDGDPCTARGSCPYGNQTCSCVRAAGGTQRTFLCFTPPDGGVNPGRDAGVAGACAHTTECATGVCCGFRQATTGRCLSAANCTRFGGTELP